MTVKDIKKHFNILQSSKSFEIVGNITTSKISKGEFTLSNGVMDAGILLVSYQLNSIEKDYVIKQKLTRTIQLEKFNNISDLMGYIKQWVLDILIDHEKNKKINLR